MEPKLTFSQTVERVMVMRRLKAVDIAEKSGITAPYLSKLSTGRVKEPTWQKACAIIDALGVSLDEFRRIQEGTTDERKSESSAAMNIGIACKQIAKEQRITAAEISRNTGIAQSYLSMLFAGKIGDPQVRKLYRIAHELDYTLDELIEYADSK